MKKLHQSIQFLSITVLFIFFGNLVSAQNCYVTRTGSSYHTETCRYLKYSKICMNLDDAIRQGYEKCKVCKPTRNNEICRTSPTQTEIPKCTTVQCASTTQSGKRCKNKTKDCSGRCHHHRA